jgi:dihydrofolate synthase/folylpolyglutamate synthase
VTSPLARALTLLHARVPLGMRFGLGPMTEACARFGHPERTFEVAHIAGTNGKGSVSALVDAMGRADGRRVGLYTSPHLGRFGERIRIGGAPIGDEALAPLLLDVLERAPDLSFFETATLAAFVAFREAKIDLAVLEVGLGGRLDATNVVPPPRVGAITRIALDHMDYLGPTVVDIAKEKAGIAKPGVPIVLGPMEPNVLRAIEVVTAAAGATLVDAMTDAAALKLAVETKMKLAGAHQRDNARVAFVVAKLLGVGEAALRAGAESAEWPGRLERIEAANGPYLLDGAHNPDGAAALAAYLAQEAPVTLVFGALADKDWPAMLDALAPRAAHRVYVTPGGRAAAELGALAARHAGEIADSVDGALEKARALAGPKGLVVVAGSLFLVGEARATLLSLARDPPVAL